MFNGWKSYYKIEPVVENEITFYKIEFPLETKWNNVPENVPEKRLQEIVQQIIKNDKITITELARILEVNEKTIKRDIEKLKKDKKLDRIGPDKGGSWEILK